MPKEMGNTFPSKRPTFSRQDTALNPFNFPSGFTPILERGKPLRGGIGRSLGMRLIRHTFRFGLALRNRA